MQNQYRLGIDAGGTFTDFILADRKGCLLYTSRCV